jgi:hypothetical protein
MTLVANADLTDWTDRLGVMAKRQSDITASAAAGDVLTGATSMQSELIGTGDPQQIKDMIAGVAAMFTAAAAPQKDFDTIATDFITALDRHLASVGNINGRIVAQSLSVSKSFADYYRAKKGSTASLNPANVFQDTVVTGRTGTISGSGALTPATGTAGTDIDKLLVQPVQYELEVTTQIGAGATVVTCTMKKLDGTTEPKTVNLLGGDTVGTKFNIGTGSDKYVGCSALAVGAGAASGAFKVQNKLPRVPVL